jgi:uncharacterized membrane protein
MKDWLTVVALSVVTIIHIMALLVVAFGTIQAFALCLRAMVTRSEARHFDTGYVQYARWLITALTFQLAADIIETSVAPSWESIGQLAAIAAIRAFVNYFLERDMTAHESQVVAGARNHRARGRWRPGSTR